MGKRSGLLVAFAASVAWSVACVDEDDGSVDPDDSPVDPMASCLPMPAGALHWWTGDGTGADAVGDADAVLMNGATYAPGIVGSNGGQAFSFDGVDAIGRVSDASTLNPTGPFSVMAWAKPRPGTLDNGAIIGKGHPWQESWGLDTHRGFWRTWIRETPGVGGAATIRGSLFVEDVWTHLAMIRHGDQLVLFVDAEEQGSLSVGSMHLTDGFVGIGGRSEEGFGDEELELEFKGEIDEIVFFGRALREDEVRAVFTAGENGICKG